MPGEFSFGRGRKQPGSGCLTFRGARDGGQKRLHLLDWTASWGKFTLLRETSWQNYLQFLRYTPGLEAFGSGKSMDGKKGSDIIGCYVLVERMPSRRLNTCRRGKTRVARLGRP